MSVKQISVFLENKPGMLNQLTAELAKSGVNMRALSLAETKDFGIARIIADDTLGAMNALKEAGFVASLTPVLAFEIPNEAGGLNKLLGAHVITSGLGLPFHKPRYEEDIFPLATLPFEGISFPVPHDYDHHLRLLFGDYMQLPDLNKLQPHVGKLEIW